MRQVSVTVQAIPTTAERRALFDRYVKTRAEEERMEKREALRAAMNGFRELLDESAEVGRSTSTCRAPPKAVYICNLRSLSFLLCSCFQASCCFVGSFLVTDYT